MGAVTKQKIYTGTANSATHTIQIPAHNAGETALLVLSLYRDRTVSFTNGAWTQELTSVKNETIHVYSHVGAATPITSEILTFNVAARCIAHIYIIPDGDTANLISAYSVSNDAAVTTTPTGPSVTPLHDGCIIFTAAASGLTNQTLAPSGWFFGGASVAGSDVRSICAFNYQAAAEATGSIVWPYGSDDADNFSYCTFAVKCTDTTVSEARCSGEPAIIEHCMGLRMETDAITVSNLTASIPTINGQTTNFATPGASTTGQLIDGYFSTDLSVNDSTKTGQYLMYATNWPTDKDYTGKILSVGTKYTGIRDVYDVADKNLLIGFFDDTNDAWRWWSLKGRDSIPSHKTETNIFIDLGGGWHVEDGGTGDFDAASSLTQVSHLMIARRLEETAAIQAYMWMPVHSLGTMTIIGGNADRPASFKTCFELARTNRLNTVQAQLEQAEGQYYVTQSISIGDGSSTTVWDSSNQSVEFPGAYDAADVRVQSQISSGALTLTIDPASSCTMKANTLNMGDRHNIVFASGTVIGAALVLNGTPTFSGSTLSNWTFSNCVGYSGAIGATLNGCIFDSLPADQTEYFSVSSEAQFNKLVGQTFRNASGVGQCAVEITGDQTGTWATDPAWTVSSNTVDIRYTGATNFEIQSSVGLSVSNSGTGVLSISSPAKGLTFSGTITGAQIVVYEAGTSGATAVELSGGRFNSSTGSDVWETVADDVVDYTIIKPGYAPVQVLGVSVTSALTVNIDDLLKEARAYQASSGLTYTTNATATVGTKLFDVSAVSTVQNAYSFFVEAWKDNDTGANQHLRNVRFPIFPNGNNSFTFDQGWQFTSASIPFLYGDGMRYLATNGNETAVFPAIEALGNNTGFIAEIQQVAGAAPVKGWNAPNQTQSGNVSMLIQTYSDPDADGTPAYDYRSYLVVEYAPPGYYQDRVIVHDIYPSLVDELYVIAVEPIAASVTAADPLLASPPTITLHSTPQAWNGGNYSVTVTDSAAGNTGAQLEQWMNWFFREGNDTPIAVLHDATPGTEDPVNFYQMVQANGDKYKTVRGIHLGFKSNALVGVRVVQNDGSTPHAGFNLFTDDSGSPWAPAESKTVSVSGLVDAAGALDRLQIINTSALAASAWQASTAYSAGDKVLRTAGYGEEGTAGLFFRCIVGGQSGAIEPTWVITTPGKFGTAGSETTDNEVTWECFAILAYDSDPASTSLSTSYIDGEEFTAGEGFEWRFAEMNGTTSFKYGSGIGVATSSGISVTASISTDEIYAVWAGLEGQSGQFFDDRFSPNYIANYVVLDTNTDFSGKSLGLFYCYNLTTSAGMYRFWGGATLVDAANLRNNDDVVDIYLDESAGFVKQTDNVRIFKKTDSSIRPAVDPTTGGSGVEVNWRLPVNVVSVSGSPVITGSINDVPSKVQDGMTAQGYTATRAAYHDTIPTLDSKLTAIQGATFDTATDSLEQIRDNLSAGGGLDAAGVRAAVGLASANLDTQLGTIVADTNELQTNQGNWITATGFATVNPDNATIADTNTRVQALQSAVTVVDATADAIRVITDFLTLANIESQIWNAKPSDYSTNNTMGKVIKGIKEGWLSAEGAVTDASATATSFTTNLPSAVDDFYAGEPMVFTNGALAGQSRLIDAYNGTTKVVTLDHPLTSAPANGDTFNVLADHVHTIAEIQEGLATSAELAQPISRIGEVWKLLGLDVATPITISTTSQGGGTVSLSITDNGNGSVTLQRV